MVRYGTVRYGTVRYGTVRYGTVRYGTVRYGTVRYGTYILLRTNIYLSALRCCFLLPTIVVAANKAAATTGRFN
jgi:hypothetical protein